MKRGGPLKRRTGLKTSRWVREMADEKAGKIAPRKKIMKKLRDGQAAVFLKRKPIKKVSKSKRKQYAEYYEAKPKFMEDNPQCLICVARGRKPNPTTEVHHVFLRTGKELLLNQQGWLPSCRSCREYPHDNDAWAVEVGVLALPHMRNSSEALLKCVAESTLPEMLYLTSVNKPQQD